MKATLREDVYNEIFDSLRYKFASGETVESRADLLTDRVLSHVKYHQRYDSNAAIHQDALVNNLAMHIRRLTHHIKNATYQNDRQVRAVEQATEFLRCNALQGSPLRNEDIQECDNG